MVAAGNGFTNIVKLLAPSEKGLKTLAGWTALMGAVEEKHFDSAAILVSHEAKLTKMDGWTALMSAARHGLYDIARLLAPHEAGMVCPADNSCALMWAASAGSRDICELLLDKENHIRNKQGFKAIDFARDAGHTDLLMLLSGEEADTSIQKKKKKGRRKRRNKLTAGVLM